MPIFLSHTTATECWRSGRFDALLGGPSISKRHRPAGSIQVEDTASILAMDRLDFTYREALAFGSVREGEALACKPSAREVRELRTGAIVFTSDPTHLLVPGKRAAATIRSASCHVRSDALPGGSFVRVSDGLLLCSPELCFLQMASRVSFLQLVKLGHELCAVEQATSASCRPPPSERSKPTCADAREWPAARSPAKRFGTSRSLPARPWKRPSPSFFASPFASEATGFRFRA